RTVYALLFPPNSSLKCGRPPTVPPEAPATLRRCGEPASVWTGSAEKSARCTESSTSALRPSVNCANLAELHPRSDLPSSGQPDTQNLFHNAHAARLRRLLNRKR